MPAESGLVQRQIGSLNPGLDRDAFIGRAKFNLMDVTYAWSKTGFCVIPLRTRAWFHRIFIFAASRSL
jgi:hypothetical protein